MKTLHNMFIINFYKSPLLVLMVMVVSACQPIPGKQLAQAIEAIVGPDTKTEIVVVIPNEGCEGCISVAETFVKENYNKFENINYIFTQIHSVKLLKLRLGDSVVSHPYVKFDINNSIIYPERSKEIYPMVVYFDRDQIKKVDYQSPQSEGFKNLLNHESH